MPSLYTHYLFGQRVRPLLPEHLREVIWAGEGPFTLGLQGPDFLFYGSVLRDKTALKLGSDIHKRPVKETLERFLRGLGAKKGTPKGSLTDLELAYLLGFIGHFSLDASCHPYIYKIQRTDADHLALETDFDNYWLRASGQKPHRMKLYQFCCPADALTRAVTVRAYSDFADIISPERIDQSVKDLRLVRNLMRTPTPLRFKVIRAVMRKKGIYKTQYGMLTPPPTEENPLSLRWPDKPENALAELSGRFEKGLAFYRDNVLGLMDVLEQDAPWPEAMARNFV